MKASDEAALTGGLMVTAELERVRIELAELAEIALKLTQERDIDRLLELILHKSRLITGADAGSIYVLEGARQDVEDRWLRFKLSQNDSCAFESGEFTMPVSSRSIAGYAVVTKQPITIDDVHDIPADAPFGFDDTFDRRVGYETRSMMTVPMISAEGEVIGVIQLINKKVDPARRLVTAEDFEQAVIPFEERGESLLLSVASQAGIALENALLYDEIQGIFEGFVRASVQAIEQRDPTTSGHSLRVSVLACALARAADRADEPAFRDLRFSTRALKELEYASLLHDFGKIGVREEVLVKAKKLYPHELEAVRQRIWYAIKSAEADALRRKITLMEAGAGASDLRAVDLEAAARRAELHDVMRLVEDSNEPTVLSEGDFSRIQDVARIHFVDGAGAERPLLSPAEVASLEVRRGSLHASELAEIRSHVVHTFAFLSKIPWGASFRDVPRIAGAHHERLDGSGYPAGLSSAQIPVESKIMTIADIFDALTARDRPYKKAMPVSRALDILGFEVKSGGVDAELVRLFTEAEVYREVERDLTY